MTPETLRKQLKNLNVLVLCSHWQRKYTHLRENVVDDDIQNDDVQVKKDKKDVLRMTKGSRVQCAQLITRS